MSRIDPTPSKTSTRTPPRLLEVLRTTSISPRMRRITLGGEALVGFPAHCHGAPIKVFLPRGDQTVPELPTLGPQGPIWPPLPRRPITRAYSVRRYDAGSRELDVDFVLHGDTGPGSSWAIRAKPGDRIGVAGPGLDPMLRYADWYLFAGDMTALPAMSALLETLPARARGQAFVAVPDAAEVQRLEFQAHVSLTWLHLDGKSACSPQLEEAVRNVEWPEGRVFAWVAGESTSVLAIRSYLRSERGLQSSAMYATPYWKASLAEEVYHEERHRVMDEVDLT
jgi:NADPH-dependent ferric siderophore reductase